MRLLFVRGLAVFALAILTSALAAQSTPPPMVGTVIGQITIDGRRINITMPPTLGIGRLPAPGIALAVQQNAAGPSATFGNSTRPNFIRFTKSGNAANVDVGYLGSGEANLSYNMDYSTGVHLYGADSAQNAAWIAVNASGFYVQYAPSGYVGGGDIWTNQGSKYLLQVDNSGILTASSATIANATGSSSLLTLKSNSIVRGYLGAVAVADGIVIGSAIGDFVLRGAGGKLLISVDNGTSIVARIDPATNNFQSSYGLQSTPTGSKPSCTVAQRGTFWSTPAAAGVKDDVEVCAKAANDTYAWRTIY